MTAARDASAPAGPLAGLRVIELSSFVAAPLAGMTLRQLGAEVIRIDPMGGAADVDRWPLHVDSGASIYWAGLNKGKRSLVADLRSLEGQSLVEQLLCSSPPGTAVLLTNSAVRGWLEYDQLVKACPDLIHLEIRGNHDGTPAVDYTVNATVGFPYVTGPTSTNGPVNHVLPAWDLACGLYAALAVTAADRQRAVTGSGEHIRISLADVALASAGNLGYLAEAELNEQDRPRIGNHLFGSFARDFACADGRSVMIVALTPRHWHDLVALTGVKQAVDALEQGLAVDFADEGVRYTYREALAALISPWFSTRTSSEVKELLAGTTVLSAPYRSFRDVVGDLRGHPHPLMEQLDQPGIGSHFAPRSPIDVNSWNRVPEPAPLLGQDTVAILEHRLGLPVSEIDRLLDTGIVADARQAHHTRMSRKQVSQP